MALHPQEFLHLCLLPVRCRWVGPHTFVPDSWKLPSLELPQD